MPMIQNVTRVTTKHPAEKVARKRLTVLQLAEHVGNVSEACPRGGLDRNRFYEWKRRFQTRGLEGLTFLAEFRNSLRLCNRALVAIFTPR